jgi:hypothetical protein
MESVAVVTFIKYLHRLIRADAFDDSVIINLIDSETIRLLTYYFNPTETAREHPISHHWTVDWDVATIIQALEELYPLQQEHRHLDRGSRWLQVVADSRARALIQAENIDVFDEFIDVFATKVRREPTAVEPMKIVVDEDKWRLPCNREPPRKHSEEKQKEIRKQVDALLKLGVIKESKAT